MTTIRQATRDDALILGALTLQEGVAAGGPDRRGQIAVADHDADDARIDGVRPADGVRESDGVFLSAKPADESDDQSVVGNLEGLAGCETIVGGGGGPGGPEAARPARRGDAGISP